MEIDTFDRNYREIIDNYEKYKIFLEIPSRISGDYRNVNQEIICKMLLSNHKYKLTLDIFAEENIDTDTLNKINLNVKPYQGKDVKLESENKPVVKPQLEVEVGYSYLNYFQIRK